MRKAVENEGPSGCEAIDCCRGSQMCLNAGGYSVNYFTVKYILWCLLGLLTNNIHLKNLQSLFCTLQS